MNPVDRDRGLRLVGVLTSALAVASVVAVGATTALAAGETKDQDALKVSAAKNVGDTGIAVDEEATSSPAPKATQKKTKAATSRKTRTTSPSDTSTKSAKSRTTKSQSTDDKSTDGTTAAKPATTKPKAKKTTAPATTAAAEPPPVASTGS